MPNEKDSIPNVEELEDLLSLPTDSLIQVFRSLDGDIGILGVGGKMGPTLACMAVRASHAAGVQRRVVGISRFSSGGLDARFRASGAYTIRCDLLNRAELSNLPDFPTITYVVGQQSSACGS